MGAILLIIASILKWIFTPLLWVYGVVSALNKKQFNEYSTELAIAKDCYGNVLGQYIFNSWLITKDGYKFGNRKQTISAVIGHNKLQGTLSKFGMFIYSILNKIQPNHCEKAVEAEENKNKNI